MHNNEKYARNREIHLQQWVNMSRDDDDDDHAGQDDTVSAVGAWYLAVRSSSSEGGSASSMARRPASCAGASYTRSSMWRRSALLYAVDTCTSA